MSNSQNNKTQRSSGKRKKRQSPFARFMRGLGRFLLILAETVLLIAMALYGVMYVLCNGPSPTARDRFVMSVRESSAAGFLADWFFTEEEIAQIEANRFVGDYEEKTDTSLVTINTDKQPADSESGPQPDAWGLIDDDGDGIILCPVKGEGYNGYMMVVLDPSRVIMGSIPSSFGHEGYTLSQYVEHWGGVAGLNGGGFYDPDGFGDGSTPDSKVVCNGKIYYGEFGFGQYNCFVGFDSDYKMHVGQLTNDEIVAKNIQYGVCFGPALVINGEPVDPDTMASGVNPRSAIGQRSDGAVLLLVIDGRQATSLGASFQDMEDIMLSYGAVNACNLDGGSSSLLWYQGDYVNNKAHVIGVRKIPTCFVVLKEGVSAGE